MKVHSTKVVQKLFLLFLIAVTPTYALNPAVDNIQIADFDYQVEKVKTDFYLLKGPRYNSNVGVYLGEEGTVLVDPMTGIGDQEQLFNAIKTLSGKPVKYVINTHSHPDHSGANDFFKAQGATLVSQQNAKFTTALIDQTFDSQEVIELKSESIELYHVVAHTFDDILVRFTNNNVIMMGDTYMTDSVPHYYYGGGSEGHQNILKKALQLGDDQTIYVAAHGRMQSTFEQLHHYAEQSRQWSARISELTQNGMTSAQIVNDAIIQELAAYFTGSDKISTISLMRSIDKVIATDGIAKTDYQPTLTAFTGIYEQDDGLLYEITVSDERLFFRRKSTFIYELVPVSENKFQLRGQFPLKHVNFSEDKQVMNFFDGKNTHTANKQ